MTTSDVLRALIERWYILIAGICVTMVAVLWLQASAGLYQMQVDVQFLPPPSFVRDATNNPENDLVALAGLIERQVDPQDERLEPALADAPLAGLGVTTGTMVVLPNEDGQFDYAFRQPLLRVKTVGRSPEEASTLLYQRVTMIEQALDAVQAKDGVVPRNRIGSRLVPAIPPVQVAAGSVPIATAVASLLGLGLTCVACVFADRFLVKHRPRRGGGAPSSRATAS